MCHGLMSNGYPSCQLWMRCDTADYNVPKPSQAKPTHTHLTCMHTALLHDAMFSVWSFSLSRNTSGMCEVPSCPISICIKSGREKGRERKERVWGGGGGDNGCGDYS